MTVKEAREQRKRFLSKPYSHSHNMVDEFAGLFGAKTGDKVCTICGVNSYMLEEEEKKQERNKK